MKMYLIDLEAMPDGGYAPPQSCDFRVVPEGMAIWPEELSREDFTAYNGFVTLAVEKNERSGVHTVTAYEPNIEAWEKWKASRPAEATYRPTETEKLRADVDYLSMMTGVELPE